MKNACNKSCAWNGKINKILNMTEKVKTFYSHNSYILKIDVQMPNLWYILHYIWSSIYKMLRTHIKKLQYFIRDWSLEYWAPPHCFFACWIIWLDLWVLGLFFLNFKARKLKQMLYTSHIMTSTVLKYGKYWEHVLGR